MLASDALTSASRNRKLLCAVNLELLNATRELHILTSEAAASRKYTPHEYVTMMRESFGDRNVNHWAVPETREAYGRFFLILNNIERLIQAHSYSPVNTHPALHPPTIHEFIAKTQQQLLLILILDPARLGVSIAAAVTSLTDLDTALVRNGFT